MDKKIIVWTFAILLVLPAAIMFINQGKKGKVAKIERRLKGEFPKLSTLKKSPDTYFGKVDNYVEDHFPFRTFCLNTYSAYQRRMKTSDVTKKIIHGKENWWYRNYQQEYAYYVGDSTYTNVKYNKIKAFLKAQNNFFIRKGIPTYLLVPRNKYYVAPQYLPGYIRDRKTASLPFDIFHKRMSKDKKMPEILNTGPQMIAARKKGLEPYYKKGTHWNTIGSFFGYRMLMNQVKKDFPDIKIVRQQQLKYRKPTLMDTPLFEQKDMAVLEPELKEWYVAKGGFKVQKTYKKYTIALKSKSHTIKTGNPGPRLLIIGDSFTDFLIPYLYCSFSEILFLNHNRGSFSRKEAMAFKPDLVVFEIYESFLNDDWGSKAQN